MTLEDFFSITIIEGAIAFFLIVGAFFCLVASIGLLRFKNFYERFHMPALVTLGGLFCSIVAYIFVMLFSKHVFPYHVLILLIFMFFITPIYTMILGRSALYREMFFLIKNQSKEELSKIIDLHLRAGINAEKKDKTPLE